MSSSLAWWQKEVIYQIVVPSFLDTNGDGLGDLPGVTQRLEYLEWLGIGAIWLSPIHPSPLADLGYDIADHWDIHPRFGTLADFDQLLDQAHRRGIKIILDWVPNHTSAQHPWFKESASSRDNPRRDWYIWSDPRPDGGPPNNWLSMFGGIAWKWHEPTGQYYLHTFLDQQPDLNWRNPELQEAMLDTMRFWLERGVDGFRVDALDLVLKDEQFRDNTPNPNWQEGEAYALKVSTEYTRNLPGLHQLVARMRGVADQYEDRMLCGELYLSIEDLVTYYGQDQPELHLPFNMEFAWADWHSDQMACDIQQYLQALPDGAWPTWMISTHDAPRMGARLEGEQRRVAATLLLSIGGTPVHYYGEEIGMRGVDIPPEEAIDPQGRLSGRNRDPERTPMQWNGEPTAGFSSAAPWLPIGEDRTTANVASQTGDPRSLLSLYRRLITLRKEHPVLIQGGHRWHSCRGDLLAYERTSDQENLLVILNRASSPHTLHLEAPARGRVLLSSFLDYEAKPVTAPFQIRGDEALVIKLDAR